jgi:single-strand DNA-binding protein
MGLNKVILQGNLTRDPEIKYSQTGNAIAEFGLAVNRRFKQGDALKEEVCFVDVTVFGKQAETVQNFMTKGRGVIVEGRLRQSRWTNEAGENRNKLDIIAESVIFLDGKQVEGEGAQS